MSNFHGTEFEIWAGLGPVGSTGKKLGQLLATFEASFFMVSWAKKIDFFKKYCSVLTKKLHNISFSMIY